jgi:hypothetical protein
VQTRISRSSQIFLLIDRGLIERSRVIKRGAVAGLRMPPAGDAGDDIQTAPTAQLVLLNFAGQQRTRAWDAPIANR